MIEEIEEYCTWRQRHETELDSALSLAVWLVGSLTTHFNLERRTGCVFTIAFEYDL
jgi:hypothetical protein